MKNSRTTEDIRSPLSRICLLFHFNRIAATFHSVISLQRLERGTTSINLVPEYNSDDDSGDVGDAQKSIEPLDPNETANSNTAPCSAEENKSLPFPKTISSFASIIVGGRSPSQNSQNPPSSDTVPADDAAITADLMAIEKEHMSQKQFKRKRRIEFSIQHKRDPNPTENSVGSDGGTAPIEDIYGESNGTEITMCSSKSNLGDLYDNFQRGSSESQIVGDRRSAEPEPVGDVHRTLEEIAQLRSVLEAKLQFLCQGQNEIELKPVQVMHIQLQVSG